MASASDTDAVSATLDSTTVDTVTITGRYKTIEVQNREAAGGVDIWFKIGGTPSTAGAGCYCVPAASALAVDVLTDGENLDDDKVVKVIGNGNDYTVSGVGR
jgi:hypothetical protein